MPIPSPLEIFIVVGILFLAVLITAVSIYLFYRQFKRDKKFSEQTKNSKKRGEPKSTEEEDYVQK